MHGEKLNSLISKTTSKNKIEIYSSLQIVVRLPTMQETRVQSLGREDSLEKEMATHSSILAWKIPWMENSGRLQFMGSQRVRHDWVTSLSFQIVVENQQATHIYLMPST